MRVYHTTVEKEYKILVLTISVLGNFDFGTICVLGNFDFGTICVLGNFDFGTICVLGNFDFGTKYLCTG